MRDVDVILTLTGGLAAAFFVTSMYLAYNSNRRLTSSIFTGTTAPVTAPAKPVGSHK